MAQTHKTIPSPPHRLQSVALIWCFGPLLTVASIYVLTVAIIKSGETARSSLLIVALSATLALLVKLRRAGTTPAASCGGIICFLITSCTIQPSGWLFHSAAVPLVIMLACSFLATRLSRTRKLTLGLAEDPQGRNAAQVIANLGLAGALAPLALLVSKVAPSILTAAPVLGTILLAAIAEAAADTVSSEVGSIFGGQPFLITTLRRVAPGTDGAVSLVGTLAGTLAAVLVVASGIWALQMSSAQAALALFGALAGLIFDSFLGATAERRGWLGNDLVNFCSTVFAALAALTAVMIAAH